MRHNLFDFAEIKTLQPNWSHFRLLAFPREFIKGLSFFINFNPLIELNVSENFILSMQSITLVSKSVAGDCAFDIKCHFFTLLRKEHLLCIIKDSEAIMSAHLEKLIVIETDNISLVSCIDSFNNVPSFPANKLDLLIVKSKANVFFTSKGVKNFTPQLCLVHQCQL